MSFRPTTASSFDGTRLFVRARAGHVDAPVLLFCDGLGCDGFVFEPLWDELAREFEVVHFQYRGHGRSERGPRCDVSAEVFAADLLAVRRSIRRDVIVVGHSWGVQVALEAHRLDPSALHGLVLLNGTSGRATATFKNGDWLERWLPRVETWARAHPRWARRLWRSVPSDLAVGFGRLLGDISPSVRTDVIAAYFQHLSCLDVDFFLELLKASGRHDSSDHLEHVRVPALVVGGHLDSFTPIALSEKLASALPSARLVVLPDTTHLLPLEAPRVLARLIEEFATRVE